MQDPPKAVWSIPYVSVTFFPSLKHNFIVYRSFNVSDCIFEIHQLQQQLKYILQKPDCHNQAFVGCISISAAAVHLNLKL